MNQLFTMEVILPLIIIIVFAVKFLNWTDKKPLHENPKHPAPILDVSSTKNNFLEISHKLIACLNSHKIKYTVSHEGSLYNMLFMVENTEVDIYIRIDKDGDYLKFSSVLNYEIPDVKMIKVSELVTRLNENLIWGHFNLYYDLRLLVYDVIVRLDDVDVTNDLLESNIGQCRRIPGKYRPLFKRVIENDEEPLLVAIDFNTQPETNINGSAE